MKKNALQFTVLIEQDEEGLFVAKVPDLQGCATQGKTVQQAIDRVREAIQVCIEAEKIMPAPLRFVGIQQVEIRL
jgi:predicted RNase H-like HicB family nuclease